MLSRCPVMQIFFPGSKPAADMPLGFIYIKHLPGLRGKGRIDIEKPFCHILVYRGFTDAKALSRLPHSGVVLYNIIGNADGPFRNIILQRKSPE